MTKRNKIMICGAGGFIGQNLFKYFNSLSNFEAHGTYFINRPQTPSPTIIKADLRDKNTALRITKGMDIVINAAGQISGIGVFSKEKDAKAIAEVNGSINSNLINAAHLNDVRHFIFLSCTIMYPSSDIPLTEDGIDITKIHPIYLKSAGMKISGEELCEFYAGLKSTKFTVVRHSNTYGPHDKFDLTRGHVLASTIVKVVHATKEIEVWGQGTETRDLLYIDDQVKFIHKAIDLQESNFEIFNVGLGRTYSINDLVEKIIAHCNKELKIVHNKQKPTIGSHISIAIDKAHQILGWYPLIDIDTGIKKTIDWYRKNTS